MRQIFLGFVLCFLHLHVEANCPRCAKIEAERAAHPVSDVGYYDAPPSIPQEPPSETDHKDLD